MLRSSAPASADSMRSTGSESPAFGCAPFEAAGRNRRHLVLEPLSRLPLRRREPGIFILLLERPAAGMALAGALRYPAGDPLLCEPCRRPVRPAPRHRVEHAHPLGAFRQRGGPLDAGGRECRNRRRPFGAGVPLHHGDRQSFDAAHAPTIRAWRVSAAPGTTPASGRMKAWTSPGAGSALSGQAPPACSRFPLIARHAKHLHVFQRTANFSLPARNEPMRRGKGEPAQVGV